MTTTPITSTPTNGSSTQIITDSAPRPDDASSSSMTNGTVGTLRLRGGPRNHQRVAWDENVVDNEGCGRKSTKICCIYHKPRKFDESSSEEDSDSDSSYESRRRRPRHNHNHDHDHHDQGPSGATPQMRPNQPASVHQLEKDSDRNAYEVAPSSKKGKKASPS